jgi:hypothetical protein
MLQQLPPDFRLRMAVHTGANNPETVRRFCDHLGLRMQVGRIYYGSRSPIYGLFKFDHLLCYADHHGDIRTDRPSCRTKDFIFVQESVSHNAMKDYLTATVSIGDVLGYYQWELGWVWDYSRHVPVSYKRWADNDGLANGALHEVVPFGDERFPCAYAIDLYQLRLKQIANLQYLLGKKAFIAFMELDNED